MENLAELAGRGFVPLKVFRKPKADKDGHYGTAIFRRVDRPPKMLFIAPLYKTLIGEPVEIPASAL